MSEQYVQGGTAQAGPGDRALRQWRLPVRSVGLLTGAALFLSYDQHVLWLVYDFVLIGSALWLIWAGGSRALGFLLLTAFVGLAYIVYTDTGRLYAVLSIWDTYKHLILLLTGAEILRRTSMQKQAEIRAQFEIAVLVFFAVNAAWATWQAYAEYHFDNVAGLIGPGGTHSLGVLSLLAVLVSMRRGSQWLALGVVALALYANWIAENIGVYVLGGWVFGYACIMRYRQGLLRGRERADARSRRRFAALGICGIVALTTLLVVTPYGSRLTNLVGEVATAVATGNPPEGSTRAELLFYAYDLGGAYGAGPGVFSRIYADQGSRVDELEHPQLNISEASHQLAEYGVLGLLICLALYSAAVWMSVREPTAKWFCLGYLFLTFFYNRLLIDERIAFLYVAMVLFVVMDTKIRREQGGLAAPGTAE